MSAADMAGQRFGKLVVLHRDGSRRGLALWMCACDCGRTHAATGMHLRNGVTISCGCVRASPRTATPEDIAQELIRSLRTENARLRKVLGARPDVAKDTRQNNTIKRLRAANARLGKLLEDRPSAAEDRRRERERLADAAQLLRRVFNTSRLTGPLLGDVQSMIAKTRDVAA